ncbi:hypothetical protein ABMA27_003730 [Loxostege sticticalis]|uniref:G-protein coupled receptors family 1 profile domain-containing protein n=1 Tax=Loxostege sticticalis TaxID=481309 RepID=A0ABR3HQ43_LOXSC
MTSYPESFNDTVVRAFDEGFPLLMPKWGYVVSAFVLFLIGFFGFFLNLLVILLMFKDRQVSITSITTLTVISFERYLMVTRPLSSRHLSSKGAVLSIVFIWAYSLALTTPPLMGWGNYVNEAANISCSVNWHEQSMNTLTYIMFLFAMGQIVPLAVITFSYVNIIRTLKKISPGVGVIPALVAKSSICYDPLIYVGMNTQFRQSIKRIFGMHSKGKQSQTEKGFNNTVLSPAHKVSVNNDTTRYITSESTISTIPKKVKDTKRIIFSDSISEVVNNENNRPYARDLELCTINENKTASDGERSEETTYDEDSGSQKKLELFGESCKLFNKRSPVVTIIDTEHLIFSKPVKNRHGDNGGVNNVYGNAAYEEHSTDKTNNVYETDNEMKRQKTIKHSYSLDLSVVSNENKSRKLSIETKFETLIQPKGFFKETIISKLFEPESKQDGIKSYLCKVNKNDNTENNL